MEVVEQTNKQSKGISEHRKEKRRGETKREGQADNVRKTKRCELSTFKIMKGDERGERTQTETKKARREGRWR